MLLHDKCILRFYSMQICVQRDKMNFCVEATSFCVVAPNNQPFSIFQLFLHPNFCSQTAFHFICNFDLLLYLHKIRITHSQACYPRTKKMCKTHTALLYISPHTLIYNFWDGVYNGSVLVCMIFVLRCEKG